MFEWLVELNSWRNQFALSRFGWTCNCGAWVPTGDVHWCSSSKPRILGWLCDGCNSVVPDGVSHKCVRSIAHPEPIITNGDALPTGWRCPSCRSVWAPHIEACKVCSKSEINL